MKKLSIALALFAMFTSHLVQATPTIKANVNGMVCAFCAQGIEKKMRALSQTQDVYVNLKQRVVAVELKEGQTLAHEQVKALIKDAGYEVTNIETIDQTVAQIKTALEKPKAGE